MGVVGLACLILWNMKYFQHLTKIWFVGYNNESFGNGLGPRDHPVSEKLDNTLIAKEPLGNEYVA